MKSMTGANAYATISVESAVLSASQSQLTTLLFEGALNALAQARLYIDDGNIKGKGPALSRAMNIIENGLKGPLLEWREDPLAAQLISLYDYMVFRLLQASLHNDAAAVSEAERLLKDITSGWKQSLQLPSGQEGSL
ncbi:flagellar export chaperone FliS [Tatumella sp. JGM118]|uniref:Flagellar secretion chaperone FliS n=1 Tax=Tatumella terrea TaxID=419007 RepID=A0ABW1VYI1_9GAMM|nr:flagellar export chaperone FliS [Tatumella sp. JGM118]MBS0908258.1 flagellar export chaperone FliS [Tatumella sp. JGM118]